MTEQTKFNLTAVVKGVTNDPETDMAFINQAIAENAAQQQLITAAIVKFKERQYPPVKA